MSERFPEFPVPLRINFSPESVDYLAAEQIVQEAAELGFGMDEIREKYPDMPADLLQMVQEIMSGPEEDLFPDPESI